MVLGVDMFIVEYIGELIQLLREIINEKIDRKQKILICAIIIIIILLLAYFLVYPILKR